MVTTVCPAFVPKFEGPSKLGCSLGHGFVRTREPNGPDSDHSRHPQIDAKRSPALPASVP